MLPSTGSGQVKAACSVEGCDADLSVLREYYVRFKICEFHLKARATTRAGAPPWLLSRAQLRLLTLTLIGAACLPSAQLPSIMRDGILQRFCQQCGRFQPLSDFDGAKRSCRARLDRHNARRRKGRAAAALMQQAGSGGAARKRALAWQQGGRHPQGADVEEENADDVDEDDLGVESDDAAGGGSDGGGPRERGDDGGSQGGGGGGSAGKRTWSDAEDREQGRRDALLLLSIMKRPRGNPDEEGGDAAAAADGASEGSAQQQHRRWPGGEAGDGPPPPALRNPPVDAAASYKRRALGRGDDGGDDDDHATTTTGARHALPLATGAAAAAAASLGSPGGTPPPERGGAASPDEPRPPPRPSSRSLSDRHPSSDRDDAFGRARPAVEPGPGPPSTARALEHAACEESVGAAQAVAADAAMGSSSMALTPYQLQGAPGSAELSAMADGVSAPSAREDGDRERPWARAEAAAAGPLPRGGQACGEGAAAVRAAGLQQGGSGDTGGSNWSTSALRQGRAVVGRASKGRGVDAASASGVCA